MNTLLSLTLKLVGLTMEDRVEMLSSRFAASLRDVSVDIVMTGFQSCSRRKSLLVRRSIDQRGQ
jgi:hypothetical protein